MNYNLNRRNFLTGLAAVAAVAALPNYRETLESTTFWSSRHEFRIDGVDLEIGDRILIRGMTDVSENGIYIVTNPNTLTVERVRG